MTKAITVPWFQSGDGFDRRDRKANADLLSEGREDSLLISLGSNWMR